MINKEPILNIGIILPDDKRKKVSFFFSNPENYEIKYQDSKKSHPTENLTASINDGDMEITKIKENEKNQEIFVIKANPLCEVYNKGKII